MKKYNFRNLDARLTFFILLALFGVLTALVFLPFINIIFTSIVFALIVYPLYKRLNKRYGWRPNVTSLVTVAISLVLVVIPVAIIVFLAIRQMADLKGVFNSEAALDSLEAIKSNLANYNIGVDVDQVLSPNALKSAAGSLSQASRTLADLLLGLLGFGFNLFMNTLIFLVIVFSLLPNMEKLNNYVQESSPLGKELTRLYLVKAKAITMNVIKGSFIVAAVQALIAGLLLYVTGVPFVFFFIIIMFFLSLIPILSTYFVTVPWAIYFIITGDYVSALIILAGQIFVVSTIDNFLRPALAAKEVKMQMVIFLLSMIGGVQVFGAIGLIYGPLVTLLFLTSVEVYKSAYGKGVAAK